MRAAEDGWALSYPALSCPILSSLHLLWHILSYPAISCPVLPFPVLLYHTLSYPSLPCTLLSYYRVNLCMRLLNCILDTPVYYLIVFIDNVKTPSLTMSDWFTSGDALLIPKTKLKDGDYTNSLFSSAAVLCVPGLGYDTHRVFETLLAGWAAVFCFLFKSWLCLHCGLLFELSILLLCVFVCSYWWLTLLRLLMMILSSGMPVFERAVGLDRSYHRLPVLLLDDFAQLTPQLLRQVRRVWCV